MCTFSHIKHLFCPFVLQGTKWDREVIWSKEGIDREKVRILGHPTAHVGGYSTKVFTSGVHFLYTTRGPGQTQTKKVIWKNSRLKVVKSGFLSHLIVSHLQKLSVNISRTLAFCIEQEFVIRTISTDHWNLISHGMRNHFIIRKWGETPIVTNYYQ